jgi:ornithine cyclodeaminase
MEFITLEQIHQILPSLDLVSEIEKGFVAYSEGRVVVPPIGEMILDSGEVHIKYGYIKGDDFYVIKIASGFYQDPNSDQMTGNGMMLLFSQKTGEPICTLLDEGHLTNIRTAVAGSIVAKHLAPARVDKIGIVGAGIQGRLQLSYLKEIVSCRNVLVWGTGTNELELYKSEMEK